MSFGQPCDEFPLSALPPLIRDAVIEAQQITNLTVYIGQGKEPLMPWALFHLSARI